MNKTILIISLTSILSGCTFTGATEVEPGKYYISSHGSVFNSREGLLENINNKAKKACNNAPYRLEGDQGANTLVSTKTQLGDTPTSMLALTAICETENQ
ncbi:hypothetical protein [Aquipseudomonas campi]